MFARVTSMQIQPGQIDAMRAAMPEASQQLKQVPGLLECKTCWNSDGTGYVFAIYQSQAHAEASADTIRGIWGGLMHKLSAAPTTALANEVIDLLA